MEINLWNSITRILFKRSQVCFQSKSHTVLNLAYTERKLQVSFARLVEATPTSWSDQDVCITQLIYVVILKTYHEQSLPSPVVSLMMGEEPYLGTMLIDYLQDC